MTTAIDIEPLIPADLHTSIAVASRAFWDDPMLNFLNPDHLAQQRHSFGFFAAGIKDAAEHGEVWVAKVGAKVAGVASWLPPGVFPAANGTRAVREFLRVAPSLMRATKRRAAFKLFNELTSRHPHTEHWYLSILAADPTFQGQGVGSALLEPMLVRADEAGVPTYLETQKESNVPYYRRFGFDIIDKFSVADSPTIWQMQRDVT